MFLKMYCHKNKYKIFNIEYIILFFIIFLN